MRPSLPRFAFLATLVLFTPLVASSARPDDWRDLSGNRFRGEPTEVLGPFAIFRTSRASGRRVVLQQLKPEDCVRVHQAVGRKPPPAADWSQATGALSREVFHFTAWMRQGQRLPADLTGRQEPLVYVVFFASHHEGKSWEMMGNAMEPYAELQRAFPGQVEALFFGIRHNGRDHLSMASRMNVPWLVTEYDDQHEYRSIERLIPGSGYALFALTRDGVPLFGGNNPEKDEVNKIFGEVRDLLELARPDDPRAWPHRLHYLRAVQPVLHADGRSAPILVGNPLRRDALQEHGIRRIVATLQIGADGTVRDVTLDPASELPEALAPAIAQALRQAVVVPAVDRGKFVDGTLPYELDLRS